MLLKSYPLENTNRHHSHSSSYEMSWSNIHCIVEGVGHCIGLIRYSTYADGADFFWHCLQVPRIKAVARETPLFCCVLDIYMDSSTIVRAVVKSRYVHVIHVCMQWEAIRTPGG